MIADLSILCVTKVEPHAQYFLNEMLQLALKLEAELVIACDGPDAKMQCVFDNARIPVVFVRVDSAGYIESVLDQAVAVCSRDYVLRIDDDERCSAGMIRWLERRAYESANHWKFSRVHLWNDDQHALVTPHLWPDHQTRLSVKRMAGDRYGVHAGSPFGGGIEAPCVLEHHKFLIKTLEERREVVDRYEKIAAGAGSRFRMFSTPEDFYAPEEVLSSIHEWNGEQPVRSKA